MIKCGGYGSCLIMTAVLTTAVPLFLLLLHCISLGCNQHTSYRFPNGEEIAPEVLQARHSP